VEVAQRALSDKWSGAAYKNLENALIRRKISRTILTDGNLAYRYCYYSGCYDQRDKQAVDLLGNVEPIWSARKYFTNGHDKIGRAKESLSMVSLAQAQAVQKLEAEGWTIVEPSKKRTNGGPVMMMRRLDGDLVHIFVMPNGERRGQRPTDAQIRDW
jgi:hypothetical protein